MAVAAAGGALGPLIFPVLNSELIVAFGWRDARQFIGIGHARPEEIRQPRGEFIIIQLADAVRGDRFAPGFLIAHRSSVTQEPERHDRASGDRLAPA